jgi:hypothetical protein
MSFNIHDTIWYAHCNWEPKQIQCPICFGKREVTLILGNDAHLVIPCGYCSDIITGPKGIVYEYEYNSDPIPYVITEIKASVHACGTKYEYLSGYHCLEEDKMFTTKEEALPKCEELRTKLYEDQATNLNHIKKQKNRSFAWNAGYHMREAKRCDEDAERHRQYYQICKDRSRELNKIEEEK